MESATTSSTSIRKYGLCKNMGNYKDACKLGKQIGVRLTKLAWQKIDLVNMVEDVVAADMIDPVVLSDVYCLQIVGCVNMSPGYSEKINVAYKANIILCDLNTKEGPPFLFMRSTIDK